MLSFLNLLQDKSFHMLAITIGLFNGLYPENKVKDISRYVFFALGNGTDEPFIDHHIFVRLLLFFSSLS